MNEMVDNNGPAAFAEGAEISSGPSARFEDGLRKGEFRFQRCLSCQRVFHRPRVLCPICGHRKYTWEVSVGRGTVYAVTIVAKPSAGFDGPCGVALVDLDEGVRTIGRFEDVTTVIGTRVRLRLDQLPYLVFEPVDKPSGPAHVASAAEGPGATTKAHRTQEQR